MKKVGFHNDNDELPFTSIGLAAALILNKLRLATQLTEQEVGKGDAETASRDRSSDGKAERGEYVEKRLVDLREFERRARGSVGRPKF